MTNIIDLLQQIVDARKRQLDRARDTSSSGASTQDDLDDLKIALCEAQLKLEKAKNKKEKKDKAKSDMQAKMSSA